MIASAGRRASGLVTAATITGGAQATKGPKNGIAIRMPEAVVVRAAYSSPRTRLQARAIEGVGAADDDHAANEAAERAARRSP